MSVRAVLIALVAMAACTRAVPPKPPPAAPEPFAHPVPVELDWPDAGVP